MWFTIVTIIYVLVCAFLVLVVLLQQGKGGGMGSAFGGSTQGSVFGGAGAGNFLTRLTAGAATLFMVLSAVLAYMSSSGDLVLEAAKEVEAAQAARIGATEGSAPASEDTLEEAESDPALDALEESFDPPTDAEDEGATGGAEPAEEAPAAEQAPEPAAEQAPAPAAEQAPAPAAEQAPAPAAEQAPAPAAEQAPAPAAEQAAEPTAEQAPADSAEAEPAE